MKKKKIGKCRLCLEEKVLINSHIFNRFFFKDLYEDGDKSKGFTALSTSAPPHTKHTEPKERLLCAECDGGFSIIEQYAHDFLFGGRNLTGKEQYTEKNGIISMTDLDYKKLKLFQLLILWRASITKIDFFSKVSLGDECEEELRKLLIDKNPGKETDFGCAMMRLVRGKESFHAIRSPYSTPSGNYTVYVFMMGSVLWIYFVTTKPEEGMWKQLFLKENGEYHIAQTDVYDNPFTQETFKGLLANMKDDAKKK